jgi:hypothetical protein
VAGLVAPVTDDPSAVANCSESARETLPTRPLRTQGVAVTCAIAAGCHCRIGDRDGGEQHVKEGPTIRVRKHMQASLRIVHRISWGSLTIQ